MFLKRLQNQAGAKVKMQFNYVTTHWWYMLIKSSLNIFVKQQENKQSFPALNQKEETKDKSSESSINDPHVSSASILTLAQLY